MVSQDFELYKIRVAFDRVKSDILHLYEKTKQLEQQNNELKKQLSKNQVQNSKLPENITYIGHKNSKKIHDPHCPYAKRILPENRIIFSSINEALKQKYTKCSCVG